MADCREVTIIKRVVTVLASIVAGQTAGASGGTYTYTFSGAGQVQYGESSGPPLYDAGQILLAWLGESNDHGIALTDYQPTVSIEIHAYVPAADITPSAKSYALLNALADIRMALEADQVGDTSCLGALTSKLVIRNSGEIIGDSFEDAPNVAYGICTLECHFRRRGGTAV